MCGITGWIDWHKELINYPKILEQMTVTLNHRGPDATGMWISGHCALGHTRLSVMDPENGAQPMTRIAKSSIYTIVYNGELYNAFELRKQLEEKGYQFQTTCDTEVLLLSYIEWGNACVQSFNGIFAFAIWNEKEQSLFLARDRLGVKPLFYTHQNDTLLFGSEPKAILAHPEFHAEVDTEGLAEIFALGPARTPGHGIYCNLLELKPGHCAIYTQTKLDIYPYWQLESKPHEDNLEVTAERIYQLLKDTVERQLISDVPICTMLSGGLDSSALTSFATQLLKKNQMNRLHTFSVDYVDNDKHFQTNHYQPNDDLPWIKSMSKFLDTEHHYVYFDTTELVESIRTSVYARDTPGMADIDGSLYLFCHEIKKYATVSVSGEAADEVFGGYPWFFREESLKADTFPWSLSMEMRTELLSPELLEMIKPQEYVKRRYQEALKEVPHLTGETSEQKRMREMSYLNITRFMPTLLDRKDRMSMANGLEVRVPFCDHRLVEYVWNIPWDMKSIGNREKGILRKSLKGVLPENIINRKKSPYPKTHNPSYLEAVRKEVLEILNDRQSPLLPLINRNKVLELVSSENAKHYSPWFGQLMSTPQMFAFLIQIDAWLRKYKVSIK